MHILQDQEVTFNTVLEAALWYYDQGLAVTLLCPCGHEDMTATHLDRCKTPGKAAFLEGWPTEELTPDKLRRLFARFPKANLGLLTGPRNKTITPDVDGQEGKDLLATWEEKYGKLPPTWTFVTGGGAIRPLFAWRGEDWPKCRSLKRGEREAIKLLSAGQQTVIPPSLHHSGNRYRWRPGLAPGQIGLATCPDWLPRKVEELAAARRTTKQVNHPSPPGGPARPGRTDPVERAALFLRNKPVCDRRPEHGMDATTHLLTAADEVAIGFELTDEAAVMVLTEWDANTKPEPFGKEEIRRKIAEVRENTRNPRGYLLNTERHKSNGRAGGRGGLPESNGTPPQPPSPSPFDSPAFHGPAGDLVKLILPHSEADPKALLMQTLVAFGNALGRKAHFTAGADVHYFNLFVALVGDTCASKKGSSWSPISKFFEGVDSGWVKDHIGTGLLTGQGLIHLLRDKRRRKPPGGKTGRGKASQETILDPLAEDKRFLSLEDEFVQVLLVMKLPGNILSSTLRKAWEGKKLESITKTNHEVATGTHVSIIGNITADELRLEMPAVQQSNGFVNRFLWLEVKGSKPLPFGGELASVDFGPLQERFQLALEFGQQDREIGFDRDAAALWDRVYRHLWDARPGIAGKMLGRGCPQVRRLACLYAVLDESKLMRLKHLQAALAVWKWNEETVYSLFGGRTADPDANKILDILKDHPDGRTKSELYRDFGCNTKAERIQEALELLEREGLARQVREGNPGHPVTRWFATDPATYPRI